MKKVVSVLLALSLAVGLGFAFAEGSALPAYVWGGDDPMMAAVIKYLQNTDFGFEAPEGGVLIPTPIVLKTEMNEDQTKATVLGNFWTFTYAREGNILVGGPCGENPGLITLEKKDGEWVVTSAEFAADDSGDFMDNVAKLANGDEALIEEFARTRESSEDSYLPQFRRAAVVTYVEDNGLDIVAFQDPGWDPVSVID